MGTYASRNAVMAGGAVAVASRQVRAKALTLAAHLLEVTEDDLELVDGAFQVRGAPEQTVTLGALAAAAAPHRPLPADMEPDLFARHYFQAPLPTFASGTQIAVVEVDGATGALTILDYVSVNDAGPRINPTVVDGQIQGGIAQGLGGALMEEIYYDEGGAAARLVPGLRDPARHRHAGRAAGPPGDAVAAQPARRQGAGRGRDAGAPGRAGGGGGGRAGAAGRRGDADAADGQQRSGG